MMNGNEIQTIEYARPGEDYISVVDEHLRRAAMLMFWVSVLSGLCVGSGFLVIAYAPGFAILHAIIYGITIVLALLAGRSMAMTQNKVISAKSSQRFILDVLALCGLMIVGIAPLFFYRNSNNISGTSALCIAFGLMAGTTYRHYILYNAIGRSCRQLRLFSIANSMTALGGVKFIYELIWLGCCALTLLSLAMKSFVIQAEFLIVLAYPAFFGCIFFMIIWIWMIIAHFLWARALHRL